MLIWTIAILLILLLGAAGYYQGALRASFTLVGLIIAAILAIPAAPVFKFLLGIFNLEHPVLMPLLSPFVAYVAILVAFKAGGMATHRQVDTYFKYKASDTIRLLYERLNSRVGAVVGVMNAFVYLLLISVAVYFLGYFTVQVRTDDKDPFVIRNINHLADSLRETKMDKVVSGFMPKADHYYDGTDIISVIFANPLIRNRLSTYPVFLTLSERGEYKQIAANAQFMDLWTKSPSFEEFRSQDVIKPLAENGENYTKIRDMLAGDFTDLKTYLETGKSPKYDEELILGRWEFNGAESFALAKKRKSNMTLQETKRLRAIYGIGFKDTVIIATVDNKLIVQAPNFKRIFPTLKGPENGTWEQAKTGGYALAFAEGNNDIKADGLVADGQFTFTLLGFALVFEK